MATNCSQLKLQSADGKYYKQDVLKTKGLLRLVQSILSKKAEPFKVWLGQIGSERLDEIADPEKAMIRGADFYRAKGYTEGWINQRLQTIEMQKNLLMNGKQKTVEEYKNLKGLKKNLRDNMTNIELVLNMLAEVTTTAISKQENPKTFEDNKKNCSSCWKCCK